MIFGLVFFISEFNDLEEFFIDWCLVLYILNLINYLFFMFGVIGYYYYYKIYRSVDELY